MSEWLERIQETVSGYPPWLVLGVGVVVLGLLCVVVSKVMRALGWLLAIVGVAVGVWYGWQQWQRSKEREQEPVYNPYEQLMQPDDFAPESSPPPSDANGSGGQTNPYSNPVTNQTGSNRSEYEHRSETPER